MPSKKTHCLRGHPRIPENLRSNGRSLYCKLCAPENDRIGRDRRRSQDTLKQLLIQLHRNARKRGLEFSLTKADLLPMPTHCPVLGTALDYSGGGGPNAASIDRTDSARGYFPDNVVIMSRRANTLKNNASVEEMEKVLAYLRSAEPSDKSCPSTVDFSI